jgi:hypothetical protein
MRLPRIWKSLRSVLIAVGVFAVLLAVEPFLFHQAVELVKSHDEYLLDEAILTWVILNIALFVPIGILAGIIAAAIFGPLDETTKGPGSPSSDL